MGTLERNGDLVERAKVDWLREKLPHYESIWAEFVGNDGANHINPARRPKKSFSGKLQLFAQAHYTMAVHTYMLWKLAEEIDQDAVRRAAENQNLVDCDLYLKETERCVLLMAYLGNVCDQIGRIRDILGDRYSVEAEAELNRLYQVRHSVLHGPRVPTRQDDFELYVPDAGRWNSKDEWSTPPEEAYRRLSEIGKELARDLLQLVNRIHGGFRKRLDTEFEIASQPVASGGVSTAEGPPSSTLAVDPTRGRIFSSGSQTKNWVRPSGDGSV